MGFMVRRKPEVSPAGGGKWSNREIDLTTGSRNAPADAGATLRTRICVSLTRRISPVVMFLLVKLLGELVEGLVAVQADGFLHLHLQDKMAAAAQVESELHAIRRNCPSRLAGGGKIGQAEEAVETNEDHDQDENQFPS